MQEVLSGQSEGLRADAGRLEGEHLRRPPRKIRPPQVMSVMRVHVSRLRGRGVQLAPRRRVSPLRGRQNYLRRRQHQGDCPVSPPTGAGKSHPVHSAFACTARNEGYAQFHRAIICSGIDTTSLAASITTWRRLGAAITSRSSCPGHMTSGRYTRTV